MKKEVIFAIIIGFGIGLAITFAIYKVQEAYQNQNSPTPSPSPTPSATPEPTTSHFIEISSPQDKVVVNDTNLTIKGLTTPLAYLTFLSQDHELISQADRQGVFTVILDLESEITIFKISAFTNEGLSEESTLTVIYQETDSNSEETTDEDL